MIETVSQLIFPYFFKKCLDLPVTKQKSNITTLKKKLGKHVKQNYNAQKQSYKGVLKKRCSENMQIYRRTPMPKCDSIKLLSSFIEIALRHECSPVNLLHIFRTLSLKNTSGWLLLNAAFRYLQKKVIPHRSKISFSSNKERE